VGKDDDEIEIVEVEGCPEWMLTMGDCMSLLLCFFVMMLAFSTPNTEKLMDVIAGMQGALGIIPPMVRDKGVSIYKESKDNKNDKVVDGSPQKVEFDVDRISAVDLRSMAIVNRFNSFINRLLELGFKNHITIERLDEGIKMSLPFDKVFYHGSDKLLGGGRKLFDSFANLIDVGTNEVKLTATIRTPVSLRDRSFFSDWRLSNKRVQSIASFFHESYGISKDRFSFGTRVVSGNAEPVLEIMLVEKIEKTHEITMDELMNSKYSL
jgi:chemotaxis protein MotB